MNVEFIQSNPFPEMNSPKWSLEYQNALIEDINNQTDVYDGKTALMGAIIYIGLLRYALDDAIRLIDEHGGPLMRAHATRIMNMRKVLHEV